MNMLFRFAKNFKSEIIELGGGVAKVLGAVTLIPLLALLEPLVPFIAMALLIGPPAIAGWWIENTFTAYPVLEPQLFVAFMLGFMCSMIVYFAAGSALWKTIEGDVEERENK